MCACAYLSPGISYTIVVFPFVLENLLTVFRPFEVSKNLYALRKYRLPTILTVEDHDYSNDTIDNSTDVRNLYFVVQRHPLHPLQLSFGCVTGVLCKCSFVL